MTSIDINSIYGNKVRVRVCGLLVREKKILLLKHAGLNKENEFWSPPGGGIEFGESIEDCLKREFQEEVNIGIEVSDFLFLNEYIENQLHAIELFYLVKSIEKPALGYDPEMKGTLTDLMWMDQNEINSIEKNKKHSLFIKKTSIIQRIIEKS